MMLDATDTRQPLSLVTINTKYYDQKGMNNLGSKEDLLTIRILESSERKIELLKKLLSPDEYRSIESDLLANYDFDELLGRKFTPEIAFNFKETSPLSNVSLIEEHSRAGKKRERQRQLSKSEPSILKQTKPNVEEELRSRKEALDFFFLEGDEISQSGLNGKLLTIELSSGYYLNPIESSVLEEENKVLGFQSVSWLIEIFQLIIILFGPLVPYLAKRRKIPSSSDKEFVKKYAKNNSLPYTRESNLLLMKRRLEADGFSQHNQLEIIQRSSLNSAQDNDLSSLVTSIDKRRFQVIRATSNIYSLALVAPRRYQEPSRKLLLYHPMVERLYDTHNRNPNISYMKTEEFSSNRRRRFGSKARLINCLYAKIFKHYHHHDSLETKLSRLVNKCEHEFLLTLLEPQRFTSMKSYFKLDPWMEPHFQIDPEDIPRYTLLVWRWMNNIKRTIHLNRSELLKSYSLQLPDHVNKLLKEPISPSMIKLEKGFHLIEQIRSLAIEHLKKYEQELDEMAMLKAQRLADQLGDFENPKVAMSSISSRAKDLLKEPQIRMLDLSKISLIDTIRSFVPKANARRPLLPERRPNNLASRRGASSKLADMIGQQFFGLREPGDLESQAISAWRNTNAILSPSTNAKNPQAPLQVVVTVQKVMNVPMRVNYFNLQPQQQFLNRTSSPLAFLSPGNPPTGSPQPPSSFILTNQNYLIPATTFVEVIFQQRQQATSLAYGRNPVWNETLFFPIDISGSESANQLVDEYLQLNLFDYNCYELNSDGSRLEYNNNTQQNTLQWGRIMSTSRQRVERHLLGSLRVPLSTLLSSAKIQGLFSLNQPMFLENYQFQPDPNSNMMTNQQQMLMQLFITVDPAIVSVKPGLIHFPTDSIESDNVFELARLWEKCMTYRQSQSNMKYGKSSANGMLRKRSMVEEFSYNQSRHIRALVLQRDARYCLIIRLLGPLEAPAELLGIVMNQETDLQIKKSLLARFVSLMSPLKYGLFNVRSMAPSIWFDSLQLINESLGGFEEKAVLLCNYFLQLGFCSGLLLADSLPEGPCVLVIVWLWASQESTIEQQLALEASKLMPQMDGLIVNQSKHQQQQQQPPVNQFDFISRLPILINSKSVELWNPQTGKSFLPSSGEQQHLLSSIGSIVTCENVYANLQPSALSLSELIFDIRSKQLWNPLFELKPMGSSNFKIPPANQSNAFTWRKQLARLELLKRIVSRPILMPLISNQFFLQSVNYEKFSANDCELLKTSIERNIKANLLKWRPNRPTYFNRTLSRLLTDKLASFESLILDRSQFSSNFDDNWKQQIAELIRKEILPVHMTHSALTGSTHQQQQLLPSRRVISWPANVTYTGMRSILDSLFASGVHNADLDLFAELDGSGHRSAPCSSQFLVACHVNAYPARIMSVWLYVAAIISNNNSIR